jgi:SWI/SNF-related matrix-associated actin-dependent regulator of chromatin subfamily D
MASNPALAAQFAAQVRPNCVATAAGCAPTHPLLPCVPLQHQAMMARMASQNGPAAAAAAGRPGLPPTSKGSLKTAAGPSATGSVRMEALPAKKSNPGRKRKSMDQRLPDHGDLLVPDSPLFTQLQDAERRVDMLISRKKHELQEMFSSFRRGEVAAFWAGSTHLTCRVCCMGWCQPTCR